MMTLFDGQSTHEYGQMAIRSAATLVEAIDFENFEERASTAIENAVARAAVAAPQLHIDKKAGKRISDERIGEEFGRRVMRKFDYIDVTIPFTGDWKAFSLSPSTKTLGTLGELDDRRSAIVIRLPDNERLEEDLESAIAQILRNLGNLDRDMVSLASEMRTTLKGIADRRFEKLKAHRDLDSKRSFPIA